MNQYWPQAQQYLVSLVIKVKCDKTKIVTKIKLGPNYKLKLWQNSKTQFVTKLKNSICDKTQKLKSSNVTKLQFMANLNLWQKNYSKWSFSRNIFTPWQPMRCSLGQCSANCSLFANNLQIVHEYIRHKSICWYLGHK